MEYRVLGALEVVASGKSLPLGGRRQRSLLAILLLRANKVVASDVLVDELWAERPPATAQHTLHAYVSRLRKLLRENGSGEENLVSYRAGYMLRVGFGELDLDRFEQLAAEGRRALATGAAGEAASRCREALALWRGPALADLRFEPFAHVDVERLEERRLAVLEDRIEADLNLGQHAVLTAELEALVADYPLRERLREQLMLALYRNGRQAEALEAYRSARKYFVEEFGLEPGKRLQSLQQAILDQSAELDLAFPEEARVLAQVGASRTTIEQPEPPGERGSRSHVSRKNGAGSTALGLDVGPLGRRRKLLYPGAALVVIFAVGALLSIHRSSVHSLLGSEVHANSVLFVNLSSAGLAGQTVTNGRPAGVAAGFGRVWVTDSVKRRVLVLDRSTFRIEDQIPLGRGPTGLVADATGIWVIDPSSGTVSEINPASETVVATVPVGGSPAAITAGAGAVWVADASDGIVTRIDPRTASVNGTVAVGQPLTDVTAGLGSVWVTSASSGLLIAVDPRTNHITQTVSIGNGPASVRVVAGSVWVANPPDDTLSRFDPVSGVVRKLNLSHPTGLAVADGRLWVADGLHATLRRIDPAGDENIDTIALANPPAAMIGIGDRLAVTTLASPAEHRGGTLRVLAGEGVDSIDPGSAYSANDWQLLSMAHDGLLTYSRTSEPGPGSLVPDLATSLPVVEDGGRTFTFHLRRGIRYSNGTVVRPEDFRRALEREYQAQTGLASIGVPLAGADRCGPRHPLCNLRSGVTVDDTAWTVTYHLSAPDPAFIYQLALPFGAAVPDETPNIGLDKRPLPATGPYLISSYVPNRILSLVRNPRFRAWSATAQPAGFPARISLQLRINPGAQAAAVAGGRADVALDTPPAAALGDLRRSVPQQLHSYSRGETEAVFLNTRLAPFNRVAVRRALSLAVDRGYIVKLAGGRQLARPTCQILPPEFPGYYPSCTSTVDPGPAGVWRGPALSRARALIAGSGTSGTRVTVSTVANDPFKLAVGRYFVELLDALGYRARLRTYPDDHSYYHLVGLRKANSQVGFFGWAADYQAASAFFAPLFTCAAYQPRGPFNLNPAGFCNPQIDSQISSATALQNTNVAAANLAWRRIDREVTEQAPWIPLVNPLGIDLLAARVGNYQRTPAFGVLLDELWIR